MDVLNSAQAEAAVPTNKPALTAATAAPEQFDLVYGFLCATREWHLATKPLAWPVFNADAVRDDIVQGRVFLFSEGADVVATLTFTETDPQVWEDHGVPPESYYVHRFATRRDRAGEGIGARVLVWARGHSVAQSKKYLRLDTWAANLELKDYYESNGFTLVRKVSFPQDTPLPDHYRGASMSLFEMRL